MTYIGPTGSTVAFQGTVPWSVLGNTNVSGSVVAFQGGAPWSHTNVGSIISVQQGSIATVIIGGSIAASFTPPANQSVSGTVQTDVRGSVATVIIGGSIAASFTPPANQSVSGTVGASIIGLPPVNVTNTVTVVSSLAGGIFPVSGSVAAVVTNFPTTQNVSGSVVAFQGAGWSGSVAAVIIGGSVATATTNSSVFLLNSPNTIGSVVAYQGVTPWVMVGSIYGSGSVVAFQGGTQITSIAGNVAVQGLNAPVASVTGNPVYTGGSDPNGSIAAFKLGAGREQIVTGSIQGTVSVLGTVPVTQATTPWVVNFQNSSIIAVQAGSVVSLSVGSVITVFQAPSIVGTYAEDAASASGDKGFLVMGARNDTLASVTSADGDYSSHVVGPAGELIAENAPLTKWISGTASALGSLPATGSLIPVIAAQGASIFTYITGVQIANPSATNVWVTLLGGTNSVIGYTVAPANGGSNIYYQNGIKTNANAAFSASVNAVGSVYISAQGFISKT